MKTTEEIRERIERHEQRMDEAVSGSPSWSRAAGAKQALRWVLDDEPYFQLILAHVEVGGQQTFTADAATIAEMNNLGISNAALDTFGGPLSTDTEFVVRLIVDGDERGVKQIRFTENQSDDVRWTELSACIGSLVKTWRSPEDTE